MKLTVYPSDKGDCLLLTGRTGSHVLIDGGMGTSYRQFVAPELGRLRSAGGKLDVVYVSHIDADHITGILQLADDSFLWKVFDVHLGNHPDDGRSNAPDGFKRPKGPRPPAVGKVWYNAFSAMVPGADGPVAAALVQAATALAAADEADLRTAALESRELVTSIRQGIQLNHRLHSRQLGWKLNPEFDGGLMQIVRGDPASLRSLRVGSMTFRPIGPFKADLEKLRKEWEKWVKDNEDEIRELEERRRSEDRRLLPSEFDLLRQELIAKAKRLGDRKAVTIPNLASLMFVVEEGGTSILLTGDGHGKDILSGLEAWGKLDGNGLLHVDVLKVQHHGSEHNLDPEFCRRITADHYVFCANGAHENPDLAVLKAIVDSRLGPAELRSPNPLADGKFRFWFNSSSTFEDNTNLANIEHMKLIEADVKRYVAGSRRRMTARYITDSPWSGKKRLEINLGG